MTPIFHLSFPVGDIDEAIAFYRESFGAVPGRREADWADIALFGAQVTLQRAPSDEITLLVQRHGPVQAQLERR